MDFIMDSRLVYCLQNGLPLDIDVYDLAEWCCLAELGSISMDNGNLLLRYLTSHVVNGTRLRGSIMHTPQKLTKHKLLQTQWPLQQN